MSAQNDKLAPLAELASLAPLERRRVLELAQQLLEEAAPWVAARPPFDARRLPAVCLTMAAMAPGVEPAVLLQTARLIGLIFAIDDVADAPPQAGLEERALLLLEACAATVRGEACAAQAVAQPEREIVEALAAYCEPLRGRDAFPFLADQLARLTSTMATELRWRSVYLQGGSLPSAEQYMDVGRVSIGSPAALAALLALRRPPGSTADVLPQYSPLLEDVALTSGAIIRLANDIGGYAREVAEQKPNRLLIAMRQRGGNREAAAAELLREAEQLKARLLARVRELPAPIAWWGEATVRLTAFARDYSLVREFTALSSATLKHWAASPPSASTAGAP